MKRVWREAKQATECFNKAAEGTKAKGLKAGELDYELYEVACKLVAKELATGIQ